MFCEENAYRDAVAECGGIERTIEDCIHRR